MKIKQTIKGLLLGMGVFVGVSSSALTPVFADCAGVATSVVSCGSAQTGGTCSGGATLTNGECTGAKATPVAGSSTSETCPAAGGKTTTITKDSTGKFPACPPFAPTVNDITNTGLWALLLLAINILTAGIGIAAIGGIVYGSILYASAGGSQEQVKKARTVITNVVIGLIAYGLMYSLLNFLIPGGLFN